MNNADLDYWSEKIFDAVCYTAPEVIGQKLRELVVSIETSVLHQQRHEDDVASPTQFHSTKGH